MCLESRFGSRETILEVLPRILEDLFKGPFEKGGIFSKTMTDMRKNVDMKCV
jgi:hypothetical protein